MLCFAQFILLSNTGSVLNFQSRESYLHNNPKLFADLSPFLQRLLCSFPSLVYTECLPRRVWETFSLFNVKSLNRFNDSTTFWMIITKQLRRDYKENGARQKHLTKLQLYLISLFFESVIMLIVLSIV